MSLDILLQYEAKAFVKALLWLLTLCFNLLSSTKFTDFRVKARAKSLKIFDNWNIAYSGIKLESVRKVLDCGDILSLGKRFW